MIGRNCLLCGQLQFGEVKMEIERSLYGLEKYGRLHTQCVLVDNQSMMTYGCNHSNVMFLNQLLLLDFMIRI